MALWRGHPCPMDTFSSHETLADCRGHWVGVSRARMTTLIDLVQELSPIVSQNCKIHRGP